MPLKSKVPVRAREDREPVLERLLALALGDWVVSAKESSSIWPIASAAEEVCVESRECAEA